MAGPLLGLSIWKSFCGTPVALCHRQPGLWGCPAFAAGGRTRAAGWDVLRRGSGLCQPQPEHAEPSVPRLQGHCQGHANSPTDTQELGASGERGRRNQTRSRHCNARQLLLRGKGSRGWAKEQGHGRGFQPGHSRESRSSSAGTVSGLWAPGVPCGCSGGAGTKHRRFPSCHEAPKARSPALPTGFARTQRRVGMCRGFCWSSRCSEAALAVRLSTAHSCR